MTMDLAFQSEPWAKAKTTTKWPTSSPAARLGTSTGLWCCTMYIYTSGPCSAFTTSSPRPRFSQPYSVSKSDWISRSSVALSCSWRHLLWAWSVVKISLSLLSLSCWYLSTDKTTSLKNGDILTTDQPPWRCVHEHESTTRKWFYIYWNETTVNNRKGNYIFKISTLPLVFKTWF